MPITFQNADIKFTLGNRRALSRFILQQISNTAVAKKSSGSLKVSNGSKTINLLYIFCSDDYLLDLNKKFLNHNYYTDILTFPISQTEQLLEAEIYISIDRVRDNAKRFQLTGGSPFKGLGSKDSKDAELLRVIFHGILHLLGYKDKTKAQKSQMRNAEEEWIRKFEAEKSNGKL